MSNRELYDTAFLSSFEIGRNQLAGLTYKGIPAWDSVGHMVLVSAVEEAFDIMMGSDDIIDFDSYEKGMEVLSKNYGVRF